MRLALICGLLLLLACSAVACGEKSTVTVERTVEAAPPPPTAATASEESLVPNVVGDRLDVAESELDDLGLSYEEIGGGTFGIVDTSNWEVCETKPAAGESVQGAVKLIVDRPGDCGRVQGGSAGQAHAGGKVPNLIGQRLDVAESDLDDLGIAYEEIGGGTFGVIVPSNWIVCDQRPAPGAQAASVKLIVDREC